ncbi:hypothetical protein [Sulfurimonas sp.]|uniref:hypothetical protein n=1 Tax=Sulfurimonas sp. TaxID=2022749 RepID=UPI0025DB9362|nr:hypothetical protein [Sulfurimonas sp.]
MSELHDDSLSQSIEKILSNSIDWQDGLVKLIESDLDISEKKATDEVDKFFLKIGACHEKFNYCR